MDLSLQLMPGLNLELLNNQTMENIINFIKIDVDQVVALNYRGTGNRTEYAFQISLAFYMIKPFILQSKRPKSIIQKMVGFKNKL